MELNVFCSNASILCTFNPHDEFNQWKLTETIRNALTLGVLNCFFGNIKMDSHFLDTEMTQVNEILLCGRQGPVYLNSLWPSDAIWRQGSRSTLVQVMACCLTAPSHYLNQCWLIITKVPWCSSEGNFTWVTKISLKIIFRRFYWNLPGANELNIRYHGCWWSGVARSHGTGIDSILPEYFNLSTARVNLCWMAWLKMNATVHVYAWLTMILPSLLIQHINGSEH